MKLGPRQLVRITNGPSSVRLRRPRNKDDDRRPAFSTLHPNLQWWPSCWVSSARCLQEPFFNPPRDRQADVEAPPPVIANKLSQASSPSRKRQDSSLAGAKLVKSLLLKASPSQTSEHEIRPSRPPPLHHRQNRPRRPSQRPHLPHPPPPQLPRLVPSPTP